METKPAEIREYGLQGQAFEKSISFGTSKWPNARRGDRYEIDINLHAIPMRVWGDARTTTTQLLYACPCTYSSVLFDYIF